MLFPSIVFAVTLALLTCMVEPKPETLVINYLDARSCNDFNNSLAELLHLANYKKEIPAGFTDYRVGVYKLHKEPLSWGKAMKVCEAEDAHLVIVNSKQEEEVLLQIYSKLPATEIKGATHGEAFAVGVHDLFNPGDFVTVQGKPLESTGFVHWQAGEPNGGNTENCVVMHRSTGTLYDTSCAYLWAYICELN